MAFLSPVKLSGSQFSRCPNLLILRHKDLARLLHNPSVCCADSGRHGQSRARDKGISLWQQRPVRECTCNHAL